MRVDPANIAEMRHDVAVREAGIGKNFGRFLTKHQWRLQDASGFGVNRADTFESLLKTSILTEGDNVVAPNGVRLHMSAVILLAGKTK